MLLRFFFKIVVLLSLVKFNKDVEAASCLTRGYYYYSTYYYYTYCSTSCCGTSSNRYCCYNDSTLSIGAIVGIVIGSITFLGLICSLTTIIKKCSTNKQPTVSPSQNPGLIAVNPIPHPIGHPYSTAPIPYGYGPPQPGYPTNGPSPSGYGVPSTAATTHPPAGSQPPTYEPPLTKP